MGAKIRLTGQGTTGAFTFDAASSLLVEYPLLHKGTRDACLAFSFATEQSAAAARPALDRIASSIELLWTAGPADAYQKLLARLTGIEVQLIDSRITDRTYGFLSGPARADSAEAITRHVEGVLRPSQARLTLERTLAQLEEEMEERRLVAEAKRLLQAEHGMSEEQAHAKIRLASRKSRKKLKEVALQIISRQQVREGKIA